MPMTFALGPNNEPVDIRRPGAYERWHGRGGLRCVECDHAVHPYRLSNGHVWLRHTAADADRQHAVGGATGRESQEHVALTFWIFDWLVAQGLSPHYNKPAGAARPDVRVEVGGRRLAYEVQLSAISLNEAGQRSDALKDGGHDVLWLTRNVTWVDQLPAVGLQAERERPRFRTTEVDGLFYSVREGFLSAEPATGQLLPGFKRPALETFLGRHLAETIGWGPVNQDGRGWQKGWASMEDWRQHSAWQAGRIAALEAELAAQAETHRRTRQQLDALNAAIASKVRELTEGQAKLQQCSAALEWEQRRSAEAMQQRDAASDAAESWQRCYQHREQQLQTFFFGKQALKKLQRRSGDSSS